MSEYFTKKILLLQYSEKYQLDKEYTALIYSQIGIPQKLAVAHVEE